MELCIGISLVILSIGIAVSLIALVDYSISIHRKRIEVGPNKTDFNSNNNEERA